MDEHTETCRPGHSCSPALTQWPQLPVQVAELQHAHAWDAEMVEVHV